MQTDTSAFTGCCEWFLYYVTRAGERGLSIVPYRSSKHGDAFFLEFHAVAHEDQTRFNTGDVAVALGLRHAIRYCPWCGVDLKDFYAHQFAALPYVRWDECATAFVEDSGTTTESSDHRPTWGM